MMATLACLLPLAGAVPAHADPARALAAPHDTGARPVVAAVPAPPEPTDDAGERGIRRASIACTRPAGKKVNYSWSNSGNFSITVYFNNHCSHRVKAKLHFYNDPHGGEITACFNTNGGTRGHKRFANPGVPLRRITKGCTL